MSTPAAETTVVVSNEQGLHARPADLFVRSAIQFESIIEVEVEGRRVDGKSILDIMTLAAGQGTSLLIRAQGPDAELALHTLVGLVERGFNPPPPSE